MFRLLFIIAFLPSSVLGQTNISGVVNNYYKVTALNSAQASVQLNSTSGLSPYDKVMIIQMKGASINTSGSFGTISNINGAGDYEMNTICSVTSNTVYLAHTLLHNYSVSDKVQLVRIPTYSDATVIDSLKAAQWDSTAGTGGVLAIIVTNTLTLQAPVSATGKGYKGGKFLLSSGTCFDNFFIGDNYDASVVSPQRGGYKGESVYTISSNTYTGARAAIANGGGGGNNHNSGGGGGANAGAGGMGGNNTSTGSNCSSNYPGLGGNALAVNTTKLFMGGGGGAGHANNTVQSGGGNGGGIVFIQAGAFVSNGYIISANGNVGGSTFGDGASGGGAGGSIMMVVSDYGDAATIQAKGGNGGVVDNEGFTDRCFGDGGGGGGGNIYFRSSTQGTTSVAGGTKGGKLGSPGCVGAGTAADGATGNISTNITVSESTTLSGNCALLPVQLVYFNAILINRSVQLNWQITNPQDVSLFILQRRINAGWTDIQTISVSNNSFNYQTTDNNLSPGNYQYRLKIIETNGAIVYSTIKPVTVKANNFNALTIYPNPAKREITITGWNETGTIKIYDAAGKLVIEKLVTTSEPLIRQNVSALSEGIYFIVANNYAARLIIKKD
jgi:hypothetical protein